jgi:hypothetical protein
MNWIDLYKDKLNNSNNIKYLFKNNKMSEDKLKNASKYFIFGYISGMTGIIASHPFDTVKTNI